MKAIQFMGNNRVEVVERRKPVPKGDWVVVKVTSSGICGTDLECLLNSPVKLDVIGGHEVTGIVDEIDEAKIYKAGDRVIVNCHITCMKCEHCLNGDLIFCPELKAFGFDRDGGNAEYMLVSEASLRPLPDDIDEELGVVIGDALGTPYNGLKRAEVKPGEWIGIFGVGPLGLMAVLCSTKYTSNIIAIDINEKRLGQAVKFGAIHALNPASQDVLAVIQELTNGKGLDKTIDCSGNCQSIVLALKALKRRGRHVQVGVCQDLKINTQAQVIDKELTVVGSRNFNDNDLHEIEDFVRSHPIVGSLITHRFSIGQAQEAFDTARKREGIKILIKPHMELEDSL